VRTGTRYWQTSLKSTRMACPRTASSRARLASDVRVPIVQFDVLIEIRGLVRQPWLGTLLALRGHVVPPSLSGACTARPEEPQSITAWSGSL
jgi:hypothetical protein